MACKQAGSLTSTYRVSKYNFEVRAESETKRVSVITKKDFSSPFKRGVEEKIDQATKST